MSEDKKYLVQIVDAFDDALYAKLMTANEIVNALKVDNLAGCYREFRVFDVEGKLGEITEVPSSEFWYPSTPLGINYVSDSDYYDWREANCDY